MRKFLIGLVVVTVLAVGGGYFVVRHTAVPFLAISRILHKFGIETAGFEGDLSGSFRVASIRQPEGNSRYELTGAELRYDPALLFRAGAERVIEQVDLKEAKFSSGSAPDARLLAMALPLKIKKLVVERAEISIPGRERPLVAEGLVIRDLQVEEGGIRMAGAVLLLSGARVTIPALSIANDRSVTMTEAMDYVVQASVEPTLRKDVSFELKLLPGGEIGISGLEAKTTGKLDASGALSLEGTEIDSNSWFKLNDEFGELGFKLKIAGFGKGPSVPQELSGKVEIHKVPFDLVRLELEEGAKPVVMAISVRNGVETGVNLTALAGEERIPMMIRDQNSKTRPIEELVAQWLFKKPLKKLKPAEQDEVKTLMAKFSYQIPG